MIEQESIKTGCKKMDEILCGGFLNDSLVEICGEAGSGKSIFALQICFKCLQETNNEVIYIQTLKKINKQAYQQARLNVTNKELDQNYDERFHSIYLENQVELEQFMQEQLRKILNKKKVQIIVIDTLCNIYDQITNYYNDEKTKYFQEKKEFILKYGFLLRQIASENKLLIININNVVANFDKSIENDDENIPAMGCLWTSMIHERIKLYKHNQGNQVQRYFQIKKSVRLPNNLFPFQISKQGFQIIDQFDEEEK